MNNNKQLVLMRGLPGSGKSTRALSLGGVICSSDHYMLNDGGEYEFSSDKLVFTHGQCEDKCLSAMRRGEPLIVIDNCNLVLSCYINYFLKAIEYGYSVRFEDVKTELTAETLAARCIHGCPAEKIKQMMLGAKYHSAEEVVSMIRYFYKK